MSRDAQTRRLQCSGHWTVEGLSLHDPGSVRLKAGDSAEWGLDTTAIRSLDTAGALRLRRLLEQWRSAELRVATDSLPEQHRAMLELVANYQAAESRPSAGWTPLHTIGEVTVRSVGATFAFLSFVGDFALDSGPRLLRPHRLRWKQVVGEIEHAGVRALPLLGLLVFLTGVVIAYQGGAPLEQYGANIFLVDLLTLTMLREMAPLMTAVIVAGRTGSAYAAQIGTMRITEEVDALRSIGISPYEMLALPKLLGLIIAMPLLSLFAAAFGLLGGMVVADVMFQVSMREFLERVPDVTMATSSFWVGIVKAPVFAVIIVLVACYHGFSVAGSTESVGRATTLAVVQGIFLVIVADAAFSVAFNQMGI